MNPLLKKMVEHGNPIVDPSILSVKEEKDYLQIQHKLKNKGLLTSDESVRWKDYQGRTHRDRPSISSPRVISDSREVVDPYADFPDREYPVNLSYSGRKWLRGSLLQKKATIGQFGIDYHLREDMENSTPHTVGQPSAYAEKGTEDSTVAPNPLVASAHFACAQCKKAFVEPTDLATHAEESKHNVWDDDPIKEEVEDANFFKESEDEVPVADPNPDPFAKALKSLEELAITTTDDDVRECCKLAIEDLKYFREGHPPAASDKVAATKSYGGTPAHPTPLGGTANPTAAPVPVAPTTPPAPNTPPPAPKPNTPPPVVGQPLTQDQVNTLQQTNTAAVDMHPTPKDKPPSNFRGHLDEDIKNDIKKKVDAPVMHRLGGEDSGCEIKEVLSPCPNCRKTNTQVVDEEDEDKLLECRDCGSFFTV